MLARSTTSLLFAAGLLLAAAPSSRAQQADHTGAPAVYTTRADAPRVMPRLVLAPSGPEARTWGVGTAAAIDGEMVAVSGTYHEAASTPPIPESAPNAGSVWLYGGGPLPQVIDHLRPADIDSARTTSYSFGSRLAVRAAQDGRPALLLARNHYATADSRAFAFLYEQDAATGRMRLAGQVDLPQDSTQSMGTAAGAGAVALVADATGRANAFATTTAFERVLEAQRDPHTGSWSEHATVAPPSDAGAPGSSWFGSALAATDGLLVVGAPRAAPLGQGAAYVYERDHPDATWRHTATLTRDEAGAAGDTGYGASVGAVSLPSGTQILFSATGTLPTGPEGVDVYERDGPGAPWRRTALLTAGRADYPVFGAHLSVVATPAGVLTAIADRPSSRGVVHAFLRDPDTGAWAHVGTAVPPDPGPVNRFAATPFGLDAGGRLLVGDIDAAVADAPEAGAAYVYELAALFPVAHAENPGATTDGARLGTPVPNPAVSGDVRFAYTPGRESAAVLALQVVDALGRTVWSAEAPTTNAELRVPSGSLAPGVYALRVDHGAGHTTRRFVVAR